MQQQPRRIYLPLPSNDNVPPEYVTSVAYPWELVYLTLPGNDSAEPKYVKQAIDLASEYDASALWPRQQVRWRVSTVAWRRGTELCELQGDVAQNVKQRRKKLRFPLFV
jgi:hypothetical protein